MAPPRLPALLTLLAWTGAGAGVAGGVSLCTSDAARSSSGPEASVETFHSLRCTAGPDNGRDCADGEDDATYTTPEAYAVGSSRIPITWQVRAAPRLTMPQIAVVVEHHDLTVVGSENRRHRRRRRADQIKNWYLTIPRSRMTSCATPRHI